MKEYILQRNNVKVFGRGSQPMLFAHGFGCDQNMWRFLTPEFGDRYKIISFDYVGCGKSDLQAYNAEKYSNLNGYVQDVLDICHSLDLKNIVFVGHSVSCMIGLLAAIKEPQLFSRLIFVGPSPCYINDTGYMGGFERKDIEDLLETMEKNYTGWANFLAPIVIPDAELPQLTQELAESFCSLDPVIARNFAEVTFFSDNRNDLSKLKIPTLIIQCSDDLIAPLEVGKYLQSHLALSTMKVLNATGHCPHMSAPRETIQIINEYLN
ncbi:MAG: alpha/beta hydrolase [Chitinophagaceae bacterium]